MTDEFLVHFGLSSIEDLPGLEELKAAGLLSGAPTAIRGPLTLLPGGAPDAAAEELADGD